MKVFQVSSGIVRIPPTKGGAVEEHIVHLCKNLKEYCEIQIVDREFSKFDPKEIEGIQIARIKSRSLHVHQRIDHIINEILYSKKLNSELFKNVDIIHCHNAFVGLKCLKISKKLGKSLVYTCHNGMWIAENVNLYEKLVVRRIEKKLIESSSASIAVSNNLKENLTKKAKIEENKIKVIYNGVDTEFFYPRPKSVELIKKLGLEDSFTILFVGRIAPAKGLEFLIHAIKELKHLPLKALIVGPFRYMFGENQKTGEISNYAKMLLELVDKLDLKEKIIFTGAIPRNDLPKYYSVADLFVLPSVYEAMPIVLLEAMACGKPLIGSNVGGIPELVKDGYNGFIFKPGDYKDLSNKIRVIFEDKDLRRNFGMRSRELAEKEFSWKIIAKKIYETYNEVMGL
ncbi:MAG: glycosyltransferase family 4 protein [Candidatus Aenigmatarchaeota archaeon]